MFVLFFSFFILRISSFLLFQTVLGSALFPASFIVCLFVRAKHLHVTRGKRGDLIRLLVNRLRRWSWRPHRAHYSGTRWLHRCIISGMSSTADGVMGARPGAWNYLRAPNLITIWKCRFMDCLHPKGCDGTSWMLMRIALLGTLNFESQIFYQFLSYLPTGSTQYNNFVAPFDSSSN